MTDDVEARARDMGWRPQPQDPENPKEGEYRGDPEKWVTAEEYIDRGEKVLPIVLSHKKQLEKEIQELKFANTRLTQLYQNSSEAIQALKEAHEADVAREVEKERSRLKDEIRAARKEGDDDRVDDLKGELDNLPAPAAAHKEPTPDEKRAVELAPEFVAWMSQNSWYGTDIERTALAEAVAIKLRQDPANRDLVRIPFWNKVAEIVEERLGNKFAGVSKVESGSRGGTAFEPSSKRAKGYSDLPADAKKECDRQATKLVGEGRAFKTRKEHDEHYAAQYFRGEK